MISAPMSVMPLPGLGHARRDRGLADDDEHDAPPRATAPMTWARM